MAIDSNRIAAVREQVLTAFAGVELPSPEELLQAGIPERDREYAESFRGFIAGRTWDELGPGVFNYQQLFGCHFLSPTGFRYYIVPALLAGLTALECPQNLGGFDLLREEQAKTRVRVRQFMERYGMPDVEKSAEEIWALLAHHVTWTISGRLAPSSWALYHDGLDPDFSTRTSSLNSAQCGAVCAFLGLLFEWPHWRWKAAKALRRGWSHIRCPEVAMMAAFYQGMHHHTHSPPADAKERFPQAAPPELAEEIRSAFRGQPYPPGKWLTREGSGDEWCDCGLEFTGLNWETLHPDFLEAHHESLIWFTDEAYHYFLPAYLLAESCGARLDGVAYSLQHLERTAAFTPAQQRAVFHYLQWQKAADPGAADIAALVGQYSDRFRLNS